MHRRLAALLVVAAAALPLAGCIREARMAMPSSLAAATERLELRGLGGGTGGEFTLAGAPGRFTRGAERLGVLDPLLVRGSGGGSFRLAGSGETGDLAGRCAWREAELSAGPVAVTPQRLAYRCEFARAGRPIDAELVLDDPQGALGTLHGRAERRGTLRFEGQRIAVRSIHRDEGGGLPTPHALGYLFEADGGGIGAVDLNGGTKTIFAPRDPARREAVIAAAIALSIFWDPAALDD